MKVIINLPKSTTALAAMMLADEIEQEAIDAAIEECEKTPTEIDMADFAKKSGTDSSELQAFNMGMALIAIAGVIEKQEKEAKPEQTDSKE